MTTRPNVLEVSEKLAKHFAPEVVEWLDEDGDKTSEVVADLESVFGRGASFDAYRITRDLERMKGYDPDESLVDIMSAVQGKAYEFVRDAEREWLPSSGLVAPEIGAKVAFPQSKFSSALTIGEVTENHPEGKSTIFCEQLGHVREGVGSHGLIVNWEKLAPAPPADQPTT